MVVGTVVQVTNISSSVTDKQLRDLFGIFGDVLDLKLYPSAATSKPRIGFVKYDEHEICLVAQHLTNTILLDRALLVVPVAADEVPDEKTALAAAEPSEASSALSTSALAATAQTMIAQPTPLMSLPSVGVTPMATAPVAAAAHPAPLLGIGSTLNLATIQPVAGINPIMQCLSPTPVACQLVTGMQAKAGMSRALWDAIAELAPLVSNPPLPGMVPPAPVLGGNVDPSKIEEIRRTVYVGNLNTQILGEALVPFFAARCGEVLYVRMAGDETQPTRFVFIEFADVNAVNIALQYNSAMFGDRPLKVNHSKNAVVKPPVKSIDVGQREVNAAMEAVRKAQAAISKQIEPEEKPKEERSLSKSPSPSRRKSHERRRSGSRERRRSGSRDRRDRKRSTSRDRRDRRRSGSRERRRDRHGSRYDRDRRDRDRDDHRRRDRSPAHRISRRRPSRSPEVSRPERSSRRSKSRDKPERKRRRSRSPSPEVRRRRSPSSDSSPDRHSRKHKRQERSKERKRGSTRHASSSPPPPPPPTAAVADDDEEEDMSTSASE